MYKINELFSYFKRKDSRFMNVDGVPVLSVKGGVLEMEKEKQDIICLKM